jgi:outer membrane protein OmpA-like peptidoglycan-associated protein
MKRITVTTGLLVGVAALSFGCATRGYVQNYVKDQMGPAEARMSQTDAKLNDTAAKVDANGRRIDGVDATASQAAARADEASGLARDAKKSADSTAEAVRDLDSRLTTRITNRNKFSTLDTRSIYFDFGKIEVKDEGITSLAEVIKALREDPNAIVELRGHTDGVGAERANLQLSRDRVDAVVRYLVQKGGVDLRRVHTVGLGKAVPVADNNTREGRAKNRRVDVQLLSTQS